MQRCTLCGGVVVGGRCRECGLDNTKNDRMYRLNSHNDKDTVFMHDDCEEGLNQERKSGKKKIQKSSGKIQKSTERTQKGSVQKKISNPQRAADSGREPERASGDSKRKKAQWSAGTVKKRRTGWRG